MNELSLYQCLASPTRLAVLKHLGHGDEMSVGALAEASGSEQSNLSHQLRGLRDCGLVTARQSGKHVLYRLVHPRLARLLEQGAELARHIECADASTCAPAECC